MADLSQHSSYTGAYSGLLNNLYVTLAIAGACLVGYELEVHIPRRRGRDGRFQRIPVRVWRALRGWQWTAARGRGGEERLSSEGLMREKGQGGEEGKVEEERRRVGSRENWEFGYIYQPKVWRINPSPPVPRWPLAWIVSSLKVRERDMPDRCGLDITLHARFLRGAFFYTLFQCVIIMPILMPLHIIYSSPDIAKSSMVRASISSLVTSQGSRWLWVHALLIWYITITWISVVLWITWGGLAYRRREVRQLARRVKARREARRVGEGGEGGVNRGEVDRWTVADECEGIKRFRTVLITNVPPDMRDEQNLRDYFDYYLHRHRNRRNPPLTKEGKAAAAAELEPSQPAKPPGSIGLLHKRSAPKEAVTGDLGEKLHDSPADIFRPVPEARASRWDSEVDEVVLVRKLGSIASLRGRRMDVLRKLEIAHVKLAQRVLAAVAAHQAKGTTGKSKVVVHPEHDVEKGLAGLNAARDEPLPSGLSKTEKLDMLVQALGHFVDDTEEERGQGDETVWDVLHALPRELLDPYQSLTHLTSLFRNQNAPLIDYLTTKLSYLTLLLDDARAKPLSSYSAASSAFVTFKDAKTARLALKILDSHPKRSLACNTAPAPDWTDLLWPRLGKSVYRSEFVRGWVVYFGVWAFTLVWIFPVSLLCALSSLNNISGFIKPLEDFLNRYPKAASAITSLAPVILVALLTISICPILLVIANKAETINTRLGIHNSVLERFWKFLMVNGVVFFAIGQSAIEAYLTAFQNSDFSPLPVVASAFPTAAPYFASYILLQVAIQPFFEIFRFGLPTIVYVFGTRVSVVPRQRNSRTEYPTFSHFSQVPQQLLAGAIMHLFMLLNPLVIPFTLLYYGACYVVWKRQFTYVYGRLYETHGRRTSVRILRYSLDALALGQFVLFAFFILNKAKGHAAATGVLFFVTIISKLIITRALKTRFDNLEKEEADILCPPVETKTNPDGEADGGIDRATSQRADEIPLGRLAAFRFALKAWSDYWIHGDASGRGNTPAEHTQPLDHILFSTLDSKITFEDDIDDVKSDAAHLTVNPEADQDLQHEPDHAVSHPTVQKVVVPHHPLRAWEDIPPYQRSRGYNDQPAYTDDYDDFLWLPRDPLSTLDLDDTVEMRLALTTSAGGDGRIGDWPPEYGKGTDEAEEEEELAWHDQQSATSPDTMLPSSPLATSERRLINHIELPETIGSEVDEMAGSQLMRRGTRKAAQQLTSLFRRQRSESVDEEEEGAISLRTMSNTSSVPRDPLRTAATEPVLSTRERSPSDQFPMFLTPQSRTATPQSIPMRAGSGDVVDAGPASSASAPLSPTPGPRTATSTLLLPTATLSRSPSGRRPSMMRVLPQPAASASSPIRSGSILNRNRSLSAFSADRNRNRSISGMSAQQQALLHEVMEEERLARRNTKKEEKEDRQREEDALLKEQHMLMQQQERVRRSSSRVTEEGGVGRSMSRRFGSGGGDIDEGLEPDEQRPRPNRAGSGTSSLGRRLTRMASGRSGT